MAMDDPQIKLEKPLFYKNDIGLRFEIGPADIDVWADFQRSKLNQEYFDVALERALTIFNSAFSDSDNFSISYQIFSDGRKRLRKNNDFLRLFPDVSKLNISFTSHRDVYSEDLEFKRHCMKRVTVLNVTKSQVPISKILAAMINIDFSKRSPSIMGECFFINHTTGVVCHLYDDRGMDVVANSKEPLVKVYKDNNGLILGHDREYIESVFE